MVRVPVPRLFLFSKIRGKSSRLFALSRFGFASPLLLRFPLFPFAPFLFLAPLFRLNTSFFPLPPLVFFVYSLFPRCLLFTLALFGFVSLAEYFGFAAGLFSPSLLKLLFAFTSLFRMRSPSGFGNRGADYEVVTVIFRSLFWFSQDIPSLVDEAHRARRVGIIVSIGMPFHRHPTIGASNILVRRVGSDSEYFVVVEWLVLIAHVVDSQQSMLRGTDKLGVECGEYRQFYACSTERYVSALEFHVRENHIRHFAETPPLRESAR